MTPAIQERPAAPGNFHRGRPRRPSVIVIHVMEGGFEGTAKWFANPDAHVSAHYGISVDGQIARYVPDEDEAWHAGNATVNACSIGIELEGHSSDPDAFTDPMLSALGDLLEQLCTQWSVARDRLHIIGHFEVPDPRHPGQLGGADHHTDPGQFFPWNRLMQRLIQGAPQC